MPSLKTMCIYFLIVTYLDIHVQDDDASSSVLL